MGTFLRLSPSLLDHSSEEIMPDGLNFLDSLVVTSHAETLYNSRLLTRASRIFVRVDIRIFLSVFTCLI